MSLEEEITISFSEPQEISCSNVSESYRKETVKEEGEEEWSSSSSEFGDSQCGEVQVPQHLVLDFTPRDDDSEAIQKKVCAFWEFLDAQTQPGAVGDETAASTVDESGDSCLVVVDKEPSANPPRAPLQRPDSAVSALHTAEKSGMLDRSIGAELCKSWCFAGSRESHEEKLEEEEPCPCYLGEGDDVEVCTHCQSESNVRHMCTELQEWSLRHPKSMEPPGRTVSLTDNVMNKM